MVSRTPPATLLVCCRPNFGTLHTGLLDASVVRSYLLGAMHDGTVRRTTIRISQREEAYVHFLRDLIMACGGGAWTYREGAHRELYVVEFSRSFVDSHRIRTRGDKIAYARGYFDAEGGIPQRGQRTFYIYFAQRDIADLENLREILEGLRIACGAVHVPSRRKDPEYFRFYVSRRPHRRFATIVGSWHPRKSAILRSFLGSTATRRSLNDPTINSKEPEDGFPPRLSKGGLGNVDTGPRWLVE